MKFKREYKFKTYIILILFILGINVSKGSPRVHCQEDSLKIEEILKKVKGEGGDLGQRIVTAAKALSGIPLSAAKDNDTIATLMVDLHGMDRMAFVNYVMAIGLATARPQASFNEFAASLENVGRRKGKEEGFASQHFYISDWIVDNVYRGNVKDLTEYPGGGDYRTKTLDYVTRHKDEFPALADPVVLDKIKMTEMGYRSHRIPHLKKQSISNKSIHEMMKSGDIIIMSAPENDYDLYDIGFVEMIDDQPYLIHIAHDTEVVGEDSYPLPRLFKIENQRFYGYRWLRPDE